MWIAIILYSVTNDENEYRFIVKCIISEQIDSNFVTLLKKN